MVDFSLMTLSMMRLCHSVQIAACGVSSEFSSAGGKHVAKFYTFCFGEGIASGKQASDQSAQTSEKVD